MASPPRFFLDGPPEPGPPRLVEGEARHALRVLRLAAGEDCLGLDGLGSTWPMRVTAVGRRDLGLEVTGPPRREPEAGQPGAALPWIEVAVAWPRRPRAEEMVRRLTQLGASRIVPLQARQGGPQSAPAEEDARWQRLLRDACKQCRRSWLPELGAARSPLEQVLASPPGSVALLDPEHGMALDTWARSLPAPGTEGVGTRKQPLVLAVGPEGGLQRRGDRGLPRPRSHQRARQPPRAADRNRRRSRPGGGRRHPHGLIGRPPP